MRMIIVVAIGTIGGIIAGLLLSELVGFVGFLLLDDPVGVRFLPAVLAIVGAVALPVMDVRVRRTPRYNHRTTKEQSMKKIQGVAFPVILAYLWVMMILLGAIVLETFMVYPNIFHDPPQSLETTLEFMAVSSPGDFFPLLGFLSWLTGIGALISAWRVKSARYWILFSLLMIMCEGLVSMAFFWPRNEIMFIEGTGVHSDEFLRQTAQEFQTLHWSRLAFNAAASVSIFVGFLKFYRQWLLSRFASHEA